MEDGKYQAWVENAVQAIYKFVDAVNQAVLKFWQWLQANVVPYLERVQARLNELAVKLLPYAFQVSTPINRKRGFYRIYPNGKHRRIWVRLN